MKPLLLFLCIVLFNPALLAGEKKPTDDKLEFFGDFFDSCIKLDIEWQGDVNTDGIATARYCSCYGNWLTNQLVGTKYDQSMSADVRSQAIGGMYWMTRSLEFGYQTHELCTARAYMLRITADD